jgi:hypothetical protein
MEIKARIDSVIKDIEVLDKRREILRKILSAYEELDSLAAVGAKPQKNRTKGVRSLRGAVLEVLQKAEGPLTTKEIWRRVQDLGAETDAHNPVAVVDLTVYQLKRTGEPVKKVGPATWEYGH